MSGMSLTPERDDLRLLSRSLEEARRGERPEEKCPCCWHVGSVPFITRDITPHLWDTHTFDPVYPSLTPARCFCVTTIVSCPQNHVSSVLTCTTCASGSALTVRETHRERRLESQQKNRNTQRTGLNESLQIILANLISRQFENNIKIKTKLEKQSPIHFAVYSAIVLWLNK